MRGPRKLRLADRCRLAISGVSTALMLDNQDLDNQDLDNQDLDNQDLDNQDSDNQDSGGFESAIFGQGSRRRRLARAAENLPSAGQLHPLVPLNSTRRGRPSHGGLRFLLTVAVGFRAHFATVTDAWSRTVVHAVP